MLFINEIIVLGVLLFFSGFFSGSEVALVSLTKSKVHQMIKKNEFGAIYVQKLKANPQRMLSTILLGNNVVNIAASAMTTALMINIFGDYAIGIATGVMTFLILIFGEIMPKTFAASNNEVVSRLVAGPIYFLGLILNPIIYLIEFVLNIIPRLLNLDYKAKVITNEDILGMIKVAEEEGSFKKGETKILENAITFKDKTAKEVATPRKDIIGIEWKETVAKALKTIGKHKLLRIPVYKKTLDDIVGVVYVKELLNEKRTVQVSKVMSKPLFVPESEKVALLLKTFQLNRQQIAFVIDEHGLLTGLITLEDILEEIVGEIHDESEMWKARIIKKGKNTWISHGEANIDEVNHMLSISLKKENYTTLAGFLMAKLEYIPREKDVVKQSNYKFTIMEIKKQRITKVKIQKLK